MEKKKSNYDVAIIADGNASIGMGHIMRCSAIAEALRRINIAVLFIVSDNESQKCAEQLGFPAATLGIDYRELYGNAEKIIDQIKEYRVRFAFFDSYFASNDLFERVSKVCLVGCFGYGKNYSRGMKLIIPYGISSDKQWYSDTFHNSETEILFGSKYIPLKKAFWNMPRRNGSDKPGRLLLTSGGTDPLGITPVLIESIRKHKIDIALDVVVGTYYNEQDLRSFCGNYQDVTLHNGLTDLSGLMQSADIAISAGGMTLYELMASSVPTIAYAFADNQLGNSRLDGSIRWCGDVRKNGALDWNVITRIISELIMLYEDTEKRKEVVQNGLRICDGHGAERIASAIARMARE